MDPTVFGDVDDEQAFLVAQGDTLVILGWRDYSKTATSEPGNRQKKKKDRLLKQMACFYFYNIIETKLSASETLLSNI